jgi:hypothetical protein
MKKNLIVFAISLLICFSGAVFFWFVGPDSHDIRYLSDYFFLSGVLFFVIGMIIALLATSRWHYYRHLKEKWKGKKENDDNFEKGAKKRKNQMRLGIFIALTGMTAFAISGLMSVKIGY